MYRTLGVRVQEVSKIEGMALEPLCSFAVGVPTSKLRVDEDWIEYCQGLSDKEVVARRRLAQGFNETGDVFDERSGYLPAELSGRAFAKQLICFGKRIPASSFACFDRVEEMLAEDLELFIGDCEELTYEEALFGKKDRFGDLEPLDLSKSPGFGLSELHFDKRGFVEKDGELLKSWVDWVRARMEEGYTVLHFMKASLKDEKRDFARVVEYKTRVFMATCMIAVIVNRMLRGDFVRRFMAAGKNPDFFSAAGMDLVGGKWHDFVMHMTRNLSVNHLDGLDIERWDKEFKQIHHYLNGLQYCRRYSSSQTPKLMRMVAALANDPFVCTIFGNVYFPDRNNPSGQDATIVDNGLANQRALYTAWFLADGENTDRTRFRRWVRNSVIGDDLLLTIAPGSPMTVEHVYQAYGLYEWKVAVPEGCKGMFDDTYFAGRRSILAQVGGYSVFLPVIERDRILAINEIRKGKRDSVKRLMRAYAAAELAFPLLFEEGEFLFVWLWSYYVNLQRDGLKSLNAELRATALGLPSLEAIWKGYTGIDPCPSEVRGLLERKKALSRERKRRYG